MQEFFQTKWSLLFAIAMAVAVAFSCCCCWCCQSYLLTSVGWSCSTAMSVSLLSSSHSQINYPTQTLLMEIIPPSLPLPSLSSCMNDRS